VRKIFPLMALLLLGACWPTRAERADNAAAEAAADGAADEAADLQGKSYREVTGSSCDGDCSGHEAGFAYAKEHDLQHAADCTGDSDAFVQGCKAYVQHTDDAANAEADDAHRAVMQGRKPD
jgi:hypothetical protein